VVKKRIISIFKNQLIVKMRRITFKSNWRELIQLEVSQPKSLGSAFFLVAVFLFASCSPELQEQASLVEKEVSLAEVNFEKWYETEHKEILETPSNARLKFDPRVRLTYRYKAVDWSNYKKLNIPSKLAIYEFDFLASNVVVPFDFKEEFGFEDALKRSKQTLLIFAQGDEVIKSYVVRYYYSGLEEISKKVKEVNYDRLSWNWEGQIQIYSFDEFHLVSFNILNGKVFATETMEVGAEGGNQSSISASYTCTITWTPGPCESDPTSDGPGVTCHDVFTSTCYYDQPPLLIGYPIWNGSGGFGSSGSSNPGDQYLCDSDPSCIPHPDLMVEGESLIQNYIEGLSDPELRRRAQLDYLRTHGGSDFVQIIEELLSTSGLTIGDVEEINNLVNIFYMRQKGLFMMNIFSPDNVGLIFTFALTNPNMTGLARNKSFQIFNRYATQGDEIIYTSFNSNNFRTNLTLRTGINPSNAQAHHVFPQTSEFANFFTSKGINVHNPTYGAWWPTTSHQQNWYAYNQAWRSWIASNEGASTIQILDFARNLMSQFGIAVLF